MKRVTPTLEYADFMEKKRKEAPHRNNLYAAFDRHVDKLRRSLLQALPSSSPTSTPTEILQTIRIKVPGLRSQSEEVHDLTMDDEEELSTKTPTKDVHIEDDAELPDDIDAHMNFESSIPRVTSAIATNSSSSSSSGGGNVRALNTMVDMSSSSSASKMTRKQLLSNAALEKRRMQRRLSSQSEGDSDAEPVTDAMVNTAILTSSLDRLQSLFKKQYKPAPTQILSQQKSSQGSGSRSELPFVPLKKEVGWLKVFQQNLHAKSMSLSEELRLFAEYVWVSANLFKCNY